MSQESSSGKLPIKILYITSVCDPDHTISASAFGWANALAARCNHVAVVALDTGGQPASNVSLYSLRRSRRRSRWALVPDLVRFLVGLIPRVDVVFCQYSTKFVFSVAPFAALFRKPIVMWWSHGHVDWRLRIATQLVSAIVTASEESFRIPTPKKHVIGHGIDTEKFSPPDAAGAGAMGRLRMLSLGRITPVKDLETIIRAAGIMKERSCNFTLNLVGDIIGKRDEAYARRLEELVQQLNLKSNVQFSGSVPHSKAAGVLQSADVFVNALAAGGVGRAFLEAMAVGLPTVLCTPALNGVLYAEVQRKLIFRQGDAADLAEKLWALGQMTPAERRTLGLYLRGIVVANHGLEQLADSLVAILAKSVAEKKGSSEEISRV